MIRFLTAGESHGPALTAIVDGLPAGVPVTGEYIDVQLKRRQGGYGRGGRMKIENDRAVLLSGVRGGYTLGSPVCLRIENRDWSNWQKIMDPGPGAILTERVVTRPRPGHADLSGAIKYGHRDMRNVLERSSARETAARVAAGTLARRLLEELGVRVVGMVTAIGKVASAGIEATPEQLEERVAASELYCPDPLAENKMMEAIDSARESGDSLGGVFEIRVFGLPPGIGGYVQWDQRLDGRLAGALMGIQAIKGVEVGLGFAGAAMPGSRVHDDIYYSPEMGFYRESNGAGGIEGGMTNGGTVVVRAAMKPIPTLYKPKQSVDIATKEPFTASVERSDICAVPAACVVGEAAAAWELARAVLEKFGGDTLEEIKQRWSLYLERVGRF
ncbi:chorismate synthase [Desulfocucumis palustris]|uniref:Chorismate synthase n=1 Tax=Desulfocucumis palustris TaxID=1898651 RepID=A0A2L2XIX4_9FIRM|nr:chorismate synthase [Desulfocucumis palustris]GBF34206.1 chorismate synthase [Desulfocucumis palustris]